MCVGVYVCVYEGCVCVWVYVRVGCMLCERDVRGFDGWSGG